MTLLGCTVCRYPEVRLRNRIIGPLNYLMILDISDSVFLKTSGIPIAEDELCACIIL